MQLWKGRLFLDEIFVIKKHIKGIFVIHYQISHTYRWPVSSFKPCEITILLTNVFNISVVSSLEIFSGRWRTQTFSDQIVPYLNLFFWERFLKSRLWGDIRGLRFGFNKSNSIQHYKYSYGRFVTCFKDVFPGYDDQKLCHKNVDKICSGFWCFFPISIN